MRTLSKTGSNSRYVNKEVALNEILEGGSALTNATQSNVSDSDSSQVLVSSNTSRKALIIYNDSTVDLYVSLGSAATTSNFAYKVVQSGTLELYGDLNYTGDVYGVWASNASGAARVTELEV